MTEFGRTAAENGSGGTDHGTGGVMLAAGGAVRGGRVFGDWPGLEEAALYQRRDLMPTSDLRGWAGTRCAGFTGWTARRWKARSFRAGAARRSGDAALTLAAARACP